MPKGPSGQKRPGDVIGAAIMVAKIATGEVEERAPDNSKDPVAKALGSKGGTARAKALTADQRSEAARKAALGRWKRRD